MAAAIISSPVIAWKTSFIPLPRKRCDFNWRMKGNPCRGRQQNTFYGSFDLCDGVKKMSAVKIEKSILLLHPKKSIPILPFQPVFIDNGTEYKMPR